MVPMDFEYLQNNLFANCDRLSLLIQETGFEYETF